MRRIRYQVAASLDGFIAGPDGEIDWIVMDPDLDFAELLAGFDTLLAGRRSFEAGSGGGMMPGMRTIVVSRTLRPEDHPKVEVVGDLAELADLRTGEGKDVWLFGGGALFRSMLDAGLVDTVEVAVIPVLLGAGVPLLPPGGERAVLRLAASRVYETTGTVLLTYDVDRGGSP